MSELTVQNEELSPDLSPLIIDLGKASRKKVKKLKESKGPLIHEVEDAIGETLKRLGKEIEGKRILRVVVIVEKKPRKRRPFSLL